MKAGVFTTLVAVLIGALNVCIVSPRAYKLTMRVCLNIFVRPLFIHCYSNFTGHGILAIDFYSLFYFYVDSTVHYVFL